MTQEHDHGRTDSFLGNEGMRRRALLGSTVVFGAARYAATALAVPQPLGPRLGCVTYKLLKDYDLETMIRILEATSYEGVELRTEHKHGIEPSIGQDERLRVRKQFEKSKVKLVGYATTCVYHSPDGGEREHNVQIAKQFIDLAHDTGAVGVKSRPNALVEGVPPRVTIQNISACLRELGDYGEQKGIEVWLEVSGPGSSDPNVIAEIMKRTSHKMVGISWNSLDTDVVDGSIKRSFGLLRPWIKHVNIKELAGSSYPWRELFSLLRTTGYDRFTMCKVEENPQTERFLNWYKALWIEYNRPCG